jgi:hypothetical protein
MRKSILPFASKPSARDELMSGRMGTSFIFHLSMNAAASGDPPKP